MTVLFMSTFPDAEIDHEKDHKRMIKSVQADFFFFRYVGNLPKNHRYTTITSKKSLI
ncbi:MAG: hypothetical protein LBQ60_10590 [Bacteroidales bacterium]|nr:hypothetical protein [Bacteroidales bacterium]